MAHRDYVNKKRTPKKKTPNKRPLPIAAMLIAIVLIGAGSYGLYFITTNGADNNMVKQRASQKLAEPTSKPKPKTPVFIEEMENSDIEVELTEIEQKGPYRMQCASLRKRDDADALKAQIAFKTGMIANVDRSEGKNGVWYRVRIEPFATKRLAESSNNKIKRAGMSRCQIYPIPK